MSNPKPPTLRHRIEYLAYRGFEAVLKRLSLDTTFKIGELVGRIGYRFASKQRITIIRNLRRAFGEEKSTAQIEDLAADVFERNGANFLTSMQIPFLSDEEILNRVQFVGLEVFQKAARKSGVVLVLPHMGNWELFAQAIFLNKEKFRVGTHYRPLNNSLINAVIKRRRKRRGLVLFAKQESTLRLTNFVREGGVLGVLADQRVGSRGAPGVFFGRPTTCSPLPHLVAKRGKAQLISMHCETVAPCQWAVHFDLIKDMSAQACASKLEEAWRSSPSDVFWFEDRWRIQGPKPLEFLSKYPPDHGVTRPLRMVCLNVKPPADLTLPQDLIEIEKQAIDFQLNDRDLLDALARITKNGPVAVDVFVCPTSQANRVKRLSNKTLVISP